MAEPDRPRDARPLVCTEDLAIGFSRLRVVASHIDLELYGGLTVIVGANGAGKSTLLRTFASALPPVRGRVSLGGQDLAQRSSRQHARRILGYVPQEPRFPLGFTVREFLRYGAALRGVRDDTRVDACIERYSLDTIASKRLGKLSGGQRQRCFLAEATVHDPSVLLLDEPTSGLDIPTRRAFLESLEQQPVDRCVVMTTHLVEDVSRHARHIVLVSAEGVSEIGSGQSVLAAAEASGCDLGDYLSRLFSSSPGSL